MLLRTTPAAPALIRRVTQESVLQLASTPAAFAISACLGMITLDQDFRQFLAAGLDLDLLQADAFGGAQSPPHRPMAG